MLILAFDTTAATACAALWRDGDVLAEYTLNAGNTHSVTLLPMAEHMMKVCKIDPDAVDAYAVSAGPGSFTGVRIGVACVKGLAFKDNKPCIGVSALEALAHNLSVCRGIICPVMNARRGQVYTAQFESDGVEIRRLTSDSAMSTEELEKLLSSQKKPVYFCGDGYSLCEKFNETYTPPRLRLQSAVGVACAAAHLWDATENKSLFSAAALKPVYLRKPQAQREREERLEKDKSEVNQK